MMKKPEDRLARGNESMAAAYPAAENVTTLRTPLWARANDLAQREKAREGEEWLARVRELEEVSVALDREDAILWCFMNPKGRPSVTRGLAGDSRKLQEIVRDEAGEAVRFMVWGSRMPGIFNLGGDLKLFARYIRERNRDGLIDYAIACIDVVHNNASCLDRSIVTVSLVQGDALGGGFEAAISSNVVISERSAKFGLPESLFNLFPGMGAYSLLSRKIGTAQAERMIFGGHVYTADELHQMGLVDQVVDDGLGEEAVYHFVAQNGRRHAARCAVYKAGRIVNPIPYQELKDIAFSWVDAALTLTEADLKKMERLAAAQDRRRAAAQKD